MKKKDKPVKYGKEIINICGDRKKGFLSVDKKIMELGTKFIDVVKKEIKRQVGEGDLDDYLIVWNQLQNIAAIEIKKVLEDNFPGCEVIIAQSKSVYPDVKMIWKGFKVAIDIKSNESSKQPWFDIARLDTIIGSRINKYDEEYELVVKYDSQTKKLLDIFFERLREIVGVRESCNGVKYRPYDGKLRPKKWEEFDNKTVYWENEKQFLEGIENSKKNRWKELAKEQSKHLTDDEKKEFRNIFKCFFYFLT